MLTLPQIEALWLARFLHSCWPITDHAGPDDRYRHGDAPRPQQGLQGEDDVRVLVGLSVLSPALTARSVSERVGGAGGRQPQVGAGERGGGAHVPRAEPGRRRRAHRVLKAAFNDQNQEFWWRASGSPKNWWSRPLWQTLEVLAAREDDLTEPRPDRNPSDVCRKF